MSSLLAGLPVWGVAAAIFLMRMVDVTLGPVRTIAVVHGHTRWAVALGFVEICIWITAVSEAVARVGESPILVVAFAGGFAAGNAVGIELERRLAIGSTIVRLISAQQGRRVAEAVSDVGSMVTTFTGTSGSGERSLVYALCPRRRLPDLIAAAKAADSDVFYAVERFAETGLPAPAVPVSGWRATYKKK